VITTTSTARNIRLIVETRYYVSHDLSIPRWI